MNALVEELLTFLKESQKFEDVELHSVYPNRMRPYPMKRPSLVLRVGDLSLKEATLGQMVDQKPDDSGQTESFHSKRAYFIINLDIFVPDTKDVTLCWDLFERFSASLPDSGVDIGEISHIKITHEERWNAFHLSGECSSKAAVFTDNGEEEKT